jgi:tripartite-type tricarboxylate transporter receptor subunit TctC
MLGKSTGAAALLLAAATAGAQAPFPSKPITMILPYSAGTPMEAYARALAVPMGRYLKQAIVVENVGGAGGNIGVMRVVKATPDGYTILLQNISMATNPSLYRKLDYNPLTDFDYIGQLTTAYSVLLARRGLPLADFQEFLAYARANGDKVTIADAGLGGPSNLCGLLFMAAIGTQFTSVPYKGSGQGVNDLLGERVDLLCEGTATAITQIKAGRVKVLGLTGRTRLPSLPEVPTLEEQGLKGFEMQTWTALYGPKNMPRPTLDKLVAALQTSVAEPELIAIFEKFGVQLVPKELATPAALQAHLKAEIEKWGLIIRKAGKFAD